MVRLWDEGLGEFWIDLDGEHVGVWWRQDSKRTSLAAAVRSGEGGRMAVRFMPDGRLALESGALLDRSDRIDSLRAAAAVHAGARVLLWSYPHTTDITHDSDLVESLLAKIEWPETNEYGARIYSRGVDRVLVIEHFH